MTYASPYVAPLRMSMARAVDRHPARQARCLARMQETLQAYVGLKAMRDRLTPANDDYSEYMCACAVVSEHLALAQTWMWLSIGCAAEAKETRRQVQAHRAAAMEHAS